jgi:hypothetical protein
MKKNRTAKATGRTPPDPQKIFRHAADFEFATLYLADYIIKKLESASPRTPVLVPDASRIVNSSLSLELYLKCLLSLEKGDYTRGHEIVKLFNDLSIDRRTRIKELFAEEFNRIPHLVYLRQQAKDKKKYEIEQILQQANNTFVEWRYAFEGLKNVEYTGQPVRNAVKRVILEIKPDWMKILEDLDIRPPFLPC